MLREEHFQTLAADKHPCSTPPNLIKTLKLITVLKNQPLLSPPRTSTACSLT